jgi:hypothetical protein
MTRTKIWVLGAPPLALALVLTAAVASTAGESVARTATISINSARAASSLESDVKFTYTCTGGPVLLPEITVNVYDLTTRAAGTHSYTEPGVMCDGTQHTLDVAINGSNAVGPSFQAGDQAQAGVSICATSHGTGAVLLASTATSLDLYA